MLHGFIDFLTGFEVAPYLVANPGAGNQAIQSLEGWEWFMLAACTMVYDTTGALGNSAPIVSIRPASQVAIEVPSHLLLGPANVSSVNFGLGLTQYSPDGLNAQNPLPWYFVHGPGSVRVRFMSADPAQKVTGVVFTIYGRRHRSGKGT